MSAVDVLPSLLLHENSACKLCTGVPRDNATPAGLGLGLGPEAGLWCIAGMLVSCQEERLTHASRSGESAAPGTWHETNGMPKAVVSGIYV